MKTHGAVALVTGGARGLGRAFAEEILTNGGKVAILDVLIDVGQQTETELRSIYGEDRVIFITCDVANDEQFESAFKKTHEVFGGIDVVVNNAGIGGFGILSKHWKKVIDIDLTGVVKGCILAHKYMSTEAGGRGGVIVNIASAAGLGPAPFEPVYGAAKHGVVGLSRSLGPIFENDGIVVLCLCPAFAKTELVAQGVKHDPSGVMRKMVAEMGIMEIPEVVKGFQLMMRDAIPGGVLQVAHSKLGGIAYRFPRGAIAKL